MKPDRISARRTFLLLALAALVAGAAAADLSVIVPYGAPLPAGTPGYKYTVWMRLCGYLKRGRLSRVTLYPPAKLILLHCRYKYGIAIPEYTEIGPGLFINRFGGVEDVGNLPRGELGDAGQVAMAKGIAAGRIVAGGSDRGVCH